jgi:hypothetical protein
MVLLYGMMFLKIFELVKVVQVILNDECIPGGPSASILFSFEKIIAGVGRICEDHLVCLQGMHDEHLLFI